MGAVALVLDWTWERSLSGSVSLWCRLGRRTSASQGRSYECQVNYFESQLQNHSLESSGSVHEPNESKRHRSQHQESFLSREARRREYQHQQKVTEMQKQPVEASKQSQEKFKNLSEETVTLRNAVDESGKFFKSMVNWTASEQFEEVRELKTNNISLQ